MSKEPIDVGLQLPMGEKSRVMEVGGARYIARTYKIRSPLESRHQLIAAIRNTARMVVETSTERGFQCFWRAEPWIEFIPAIKANPHFGIAADVEHLKAGFRIFVDSRLADLPVEHLPEGEPARSLEVS